MTTHDIDQQEMRRRTRELAEAKTAAVEALILTLPAVAEARNAMEAKVEEARAELARVTAEGQAVVDAAEGAQARAWAAAVKAGWTERELRKVGITAPRKPAAVKRPRVGGVPGPVGDERLPLGDGGGAPAGNVEETRAELEALEERERTAGALVGAGA